ncbi:hypothetical protein BT96DRAFT_879853 [Gymnopus androsaceus JB14]|uniref:F-box domain-containing protein n=1 Tax=Gymnopus androsaceus JB14 TaxID=1447944 RepID=A0A6A4HS72_9AGAR|nr:hypothetical protein BT96DRAFT_879853 [Gymnopus androsaceus JB14]
MQHKRDRLVVHLRDYSALLSPIRRVPNDVLCVIFGHYCRSYKTARAPVKLASICSHWRSVVISTPSLWSNFTFSSVPGLPPRLPLIELILDRSRQQPLEIRV